MREQRTRLGCPAPAEEPLVGLGHLVRDAQPPPSGAGRPQIKRLLGTTSRQPVQPAGATPYQLIAQHAPPGTLPAVGRCWVLSAWVSRMVVRRATTSPMLGRSEGSGAQQSCERGPAGGA